MHILFRVCIRWLPFAVIITLLSGVFYIAMQQQYRQSANDPQIQMAEDTATLLDANKPFAPSTHLVDMATSLAPFIMVFDLKGDLTTSEALIDANLPNPPQGVFTFARDHEENRVTWQPRTGVRIAAVIVAYKNGYVLAGRNLREVEKREQQLGIELFAGWFVTMLSSFATVFLVQLFKRKVKLLS